MEIANSTSNRIVLKEGKERRRQLLNIFFKYINEDIVIVPKPEYDHLLEQIHKLQTQISLFNEMRQAEIDRRDIHKA